MIINFADLNYLEVNQFLYLKFKLMQKVIEYQIKIFTNNQPLSRANQALTLLSNEIKYEYFHI